MTTLAWTWNDAPRGAFRPRREKRERATKPLPVNSAPRDPLLTQIADNLTAQDSKSLVESGALSKSTVANWTNGKTRWPRIDSLRRAAAVLGKEIRMVDQEMKTNGASHS